MRFSTYDLSSIYLIFVLTLTLTTQDAYDRGNESSKLISTIIFARFLKLAIIVSLCEGPLFYFYVESSSSTFMHRLREHSCHSEYNVHSPKIYYWLIHDYGIACSHIICIYSPSWTLKVSYAFMFCYSMRDKLNTTFLCFLYARNKQLTFNALLLMIFCLCYFSCCNMVAKFYG
jgi:hypothetical protein